MKERYQRHSLIDWFDQRRLRDAHIVVVGAGAVGNEVLKNLTLLGVGHMHVFDFDRIEEHNLTRCVLFHDSDIGRYKADVAAESCRQLDPNIDILASCMDFWDGLTLDELANADAVVSCVDNFEARIRLNQLCMMTTTDFYNTGIDSRNATVELFPFSTDLDCACYECALPLSAYNAIGKRYSCGWLRKVALDEKKIPTTTVTASLAGSIVVALMLNRLNQHPQAIQGATRYFQDTITLASSLSSIPRSQECIACKSIDPSAKRAKAKRYCSHESFIPLAAGAKGEIVLSEPVLLRGVCKLCNREQEYFESARKLTDAVMCCSQCNAQSVVPEFVERLTMNDFRRQFTGRKLPCKFLTYLEDEWRIVLELED